jgi:pimeloyl-ACP methyl ester carboxylesterase
MATFIFLHGSFHAAWNWHKVMPLLEAGGHQAIALDLPGHGRDRTPARRVSLDACVRHVLEVVDASVGEIVLVAHSRNGIVISQAAERRPARIHGLIYLAAYLVPPGKRMIDYAKLDTESLVVRNLEPAFDARRVERLLWITKHPVLRRLLAWLLPAQLQTHSLKPAAYRDALYHDCPDEITELAEALLEPEPNWPGFTPLELTPRGYGSIPKVYIECTLDRAVTLTLQRRMLQDSPCDRVFSLETSHSPFFSHPTALAACLTESLGVFA